MIFVRLKDSNFHWLYSLLCEQCNLWQSILSLLKPRLSFPIRLNLITRRRFEPLLPPWKGDVLTTGLTGDKWEGVESNYWHEDFQSSALPTELPTQDSERGTWTHDLRIMSPTSFQLLHLAIVYYYFNFVNYLRAKARGLPNQYL